MFTDKWEYIDPNTYRLVIGFYQDGQWEQVFLEALMIGKDKKKGQKQ